MKSKLEQLLTCLVQRIELLFATFKKSIQLHSILMQIDLIGMQHTAQHTKHIGRLARISVSGYRGRLFEPRQQYVVSLSKTLY